MLVWRPYETQTLDHSCFAEITWVTHKHSRSARALVIVLYILIVNYSLISISKLFVVLKIDQKRIYIATYHDVIILGD